tara:strand:- start:250 stop:495 length:246 start_codon:yes stop_codon:yes gene_type:complete
MANEKMIIPLLAKEIITDSLLEEVREKVLDKACEEYRAKLSPIIDQQLQKVVDARVDIIRDMMVGDEMKITISMEEASWQV